MDPKKVSAHGLVGHCAHICRSPDGNKPFSKKNMKRDDNYIYLRSKQITGQDLNQNLTLSPICIYLSICLLPIPLLCQKISRYITRRKEH